VDQYCATGVCCCGWIVICRVAVNLHYNVIIRLITNSYNLKFKYKSLNTKIFVPQYTDYRS
jgi:hypothetical protein